MDIKDLKERKKALKLTANQIAYMAELPYSTVSKICTGETKNPQYITIEKIDEAISRAEQTKRIEAYKDAIKEYIENHPDEIFEPLKFEKIYRKENNLSSDPIPYAVPLTDGDTESNLALKKVGSVTFEDYMKLDTDRWTELINGELITANNPSFDHQLIVDELGFVFKKYISDNGGKCRVFSSGLNVRFDEEDDTVLIPDVLVRCESGTIKDYGIYGAPDFVAEVTSPSTRSKDYHVKLEKYMSYGVKEYWIVDMQKRLVVTYQGDMPTISAIYRFEDEVPVAIYDGKLKIKIDDLLESSVVNKLNN